MNKNEQIHHWPDPMPIEILKGCASVTDKIIQSESSRRQRKVRRGVGDYMQRRKFICAGKYK